MNDLFRRIWYLLNRRRFERDMADEMAYHCELTAAGSFGNTLRLREDAREIWGWTWLDRLWQDLAYGWRVLRKSPGFTLTAILVLGLGIGVPLTALKGALDDAPERWMRDAGSLATLTRRAPRNPGGPIPYPALEYFADRVHSFQSLMGMSTEEDDFARQAGEAPERVPVAFVTANYFQVLGSRPEYGRLFAPQIDGKSAVQPGTECAAVLSHSFWQRRLGGDRGIVGKLVRVNGKPVRVVGIMPAGFYGIEDNGVSVWLPNGTAAGAG